MDLKAAIRTIPNWPQRGIMFRDITTLLQKPAALKFACKQFVNRYQDKKIDCIVGIESRGFIFSSILAYELGVKLVIIRKPGKLPFKTISQEYTLEYGHDKVEMHIDAISTGENVLIVDDLIATGGTVSAAAKLIEKVGAKVLEMAFVVGLPDILDKEKTAPYKIFTLIDFEGK